MPKVRTLAGAIGATATMASLIITVPTLTIGGVTTSAGAATNPAVVTLADSAVPFTRRIKPDGRVADGTRISVPGSGVRRRDLLSADPDHLR